MLVIITEANTKNSIAIQRELSKNKSLLLIGVSNDKNHIQMVGAGDSIKRLCIERPRRSTGDL